MARRVEHCDKCKAEREVLRSVEDPSDKDRKFITLVCGHTIRKMVKVANLDKVGISEKASWLILKDPVAEIKKAVKDNDHFKTVAYACSVFEYCGKQILFWHSRNAGCPISEKKLDRWGLEDVIDELYCRKILTDTNVKSKLHKIRKLRNNFIHKEYSLNLPTEMVSKVNDSTEDIIYCVGLVKYKYDKSVL